MKNFLTVISIITCAVILRLIPHVPNFAPVGAMALFGGTYLNKKYSSIIVISTLMISDYLLLYIHPFAPQLFNFSHLYPLSALFSPISLYVYASFLLIIGIGIFLSKHPTAENIILASLNSSFLFFLITNFGVWADGAYSRNISGLWESYFMGLPFLRATVFGDLFYNGIFFSCYYIITEFLANKKLATIN